jgi:hypothetical protein
MRSMYSVRKMTPRDSGRGDAGAEREAAWDTE